MGSDDPTSLAPGFRFHPTDEELVSYYLKRKICGKNFRVDAIAEIDIYRVEPWDLPVLSKLKSRDLEWYFFSGLDKKYGNGSRTNRATNEGYWKTTGKDRPVHHRSRLVGMKKTLVYHLGRAPKGKRTNWVMHEYKLADEALEKAGVSLDCVLCRIFQKSGSGPKNGEKYGAPLADEEWEKDEVHSTVPGEVYFEEPFADDNEYIEQSDLDQILDSKLAVNDPLPVSNNFHHEDNNIHVENSRDISASEEKCFVGENEYKPDLQVMGDEQFFDFTGHNLNTANIVRNEHMVQTNEVSNGNSVNCLPNEPLPDSVGNNDFVDDGLFLDAFDFWDPAEVNPLEFGIPDMLVDDDIDFEQYLNLEASPLINDTYESSSTKENFYAGTEQIPTVNQQQPELFSDGMAASSSKQAFEVSKSTMSKSAIQYPYLSHLLSNIPAPPAFASELPSKDMAARLSAAVHSSSSVDVTAGMIRIRDSAAMTPGSRFQLSVDKIGNVSVLLSFDLPNEASLSSLLSTKMAASFSGGWLRSMLWVIAFAVSFKFGSLIFSK